MDGVLDPTILTLHLPAQIQADAAKATEIQPRKKMTIFDTWVIKCWKSLLKALVDSPLLEVFKSRLNAFLASPLPFKEGFITGSALARATQQGR